MMKRRTTSLLLLLSLLLLPLLSSAEEELRGRELRGRWTWKQGPGGRGGEFTLREYEGDLTWLCWTLPDLSLFPKSQVLLLDGQKILAWASPEGSAFALKSTDIRLLPLAIAGASFPAAFLEGRNLRSLLRQGRLLGFPAELQSHGSHASRLQWFSPLGEIKACWEDRRGERKKRLILYPPGKGKIILEWRDCGPAPRDPSTLFGPK
ncbi:MAG: hypothetical protein QGG80_02360 [Candidatus Krumholzibacteria bacterium]|nr:hypothetical protein [Candidatus Krumholzibacteria bacterium]MDP6797281.1 hypothetical protein [Candidatus Krumholzibacteria bacterium]